MWSPLAMSLVPQRMAYALEAAVNPSTIRTATARILVLFMRATQESRLDSIFDRYTDAEFPWTECPWAAYMPHTLSL